MRHLIWQLPLAVLLVGAPRVVVAEDKKGLDFFEKRIRPVLVRECYQCHSAKAKKIRGNLLLDSRQGSRKGGDSGPAVVPGKPEDSLLVNALRHDDFEMPPEKKLPKSVVTDFVKWIKMGAPDPRDGKLVTKTTIDLEKGRQFWSFRPLRPGKLPMVRNASWPANDIDRYILAAQEAKGLKPGKDASPTVLIRRLYFDLVGLPPSPAKVAQFVNDPTPQRYAQIVDDLLASQQFAERWARHWLDVARYAESSGGGRTLLFNDAWHYRDYVVRSLHQDKPYRRFVMEQVAGDLLEYRNPSERADGLTGAGFLMLGPNNYELQDKELLRMEVVDEQIDTMGKALLGLTIGCARCHDHKFDPIPTRDYYALAGIFRSTKPMNPGNVSQFITRDLPRSDAEAAKVAAYEKQIQPLQASLNNLTKRIKEIEGKAGGSVPKSVQLSRLQGIVVDDKKAHKQGKWRDSTSEASFVDANYIVALEATSLVRFSAKVPKKGKYDIRVSYSPSSNRPTNTLVTARSGSKRIERRINQRTPPPIDRLFESVGQLELAAGQTVDVEFHCKDANGVVIADAMQIVEVKNGQAIAALKSENPEQLDPRELKQLRANLAGLKKEQKAAQKAIKKLESARPKTDKVMSVFEAEDAGDFHICIRGNVHILGEKVERGFLQVLPQANKTPIGGKASGRLELAKWLTADDNPLTPRVMANRIWHHLLGRGIVATPDSFGSTGERPTHPELLDYLALRFRQQNWSIKSLIRDIVTSRTYRLASDRSALSVKQDPLNLLLSSAHRRRLDAEAIRDAILHISGELDTTIGGPSIKPGTKSEFGYKFATSRRSLYTPVFRNSLHELLAVFDLADPNLVSGKRNTSTLPTQALYMMNSPFVRQQAEKAAERLLKDAKGDLKHRIVNAYQLFLQRQPTATETRIAMELLSSDTGQEEPRSEQQKWADLCHALYACLDFRYIR